MNARVNYLAPLAAFLAFVSAAGLRADQGGTAFWLSGQYASLAAVPASPGWLLSSEFYFYGGKADAAKTFSIGNSIVLGTKSRSATFTLTPSYTPATPVLGGSLTFEFSFGGGYDNISSTGSLTNAGRTRSASISGSIWGASDLSPLVSLAWTRGVHNWMIYATGNLPVGNYSSQRLANTGLGHGAVDAGAGYTYFDTKTGLEFSAVAGLTFNVENHSTQYKNGIDSHLDYSLSKSVAANAQIGLAGYLYCQLTGDSGSGAKLGPFESKVAAIGPQVNWNFNMGGQSWSASVRGYYEFWAVNRTHGAAGFATLNLPLGAPKK